MYVIKTLNEISPLGLDTLDKAKFSVSAEASNPDAIIVRSAKVTADMLTPSLKCIARAGAGYNNICVDECTKRGITVFNTPGANANAVKELVICALLLGSRDIVAGVNWARTLTGGVAEAVEKGKSNFTGPEIFGKTLGVVGLGAIGKRVAEAASALGMRVIGYDPFVVNEYSVEENELYAASDYITLHLPVVAETKGKYNAELLSKFKKGARLINIARGELCDNAAVIAALGNGTLAKYITDFPTEDLLNRENVIAIPHLGASTPESEENCAIMACNQVADFLLNGKVTNKVN
ncbi:MAG: 3-phosphoglycerate dehydrogenase [Oscillospiraceae bacterium]|jgi:D-3-phosphoglycerate dehydrogenase|nr:3-phosphoglycerate dehydrogenase [Oscillospiraceae bacterium]